MQLQDSGAWLRALGLIVASAVVTVSAQPSSTQQSSTAQVVQINGAGATFPYPIYSTWFAEYAKVKPDVRINYLAVGSGAGIAQLTEQLVFFGGTDTPMTDEELQEAPARIFHFPMVLGAVVLIYNLPGVTGELKFDAKLLSDIFLGKVRNWNDPAIVALNSDLSLPHTDIGVVYRSDSSGTSFIFADFLSKSVSEWRQIMGPTRTLSLGGGSLTSDPAAPFNPRPRSLNLPGGIGAGSNEQIVAAVKQTAGTIGYVELAYAIRNKMSVGSVRNTAGEFVRPSPTSIAAAGAAAVPYIPRDLRVSITNPPGSGAYPISSFTWILLYARPGDLRRSQLMLDFMRWALTEGQKLAPELGYAPLPEEVVKRELEMLGGIRVS